MHESTFVNSCGRGLAVGIINGFGVLSKSPEGDLVLLVGTGEDEDEEEDDDNNVNRSIDGDGK